MLGTDAQKYFVLQERRAASQKPSLITHGFNALSRNTNYLGEIALYASFNVIAQVELTWYIYAVVWLWIFPSRMLMKEYSLSKKEGWEDYKKKSWFFFPRLFGSDLKSYLFYFVLYTTCYWVYQNGGVEATINLVRWLIE